MRDNSYEVGDIATVAHIKGFENVLILESDVDLDPFDGKTLLWSYRVSMSNGRTMWVDERDLSKIGKTGGR